MFSYNFKSNGIYTFSYTEVCGKEPPHINLLETQKMITNNRLIALVVLTGAALNCAARNEVHRSDFVQKPASGKRCNCLGYTANGFKARQPQIVEFKNRQFYIAVDIRSASENELVPLGSTIYVDKSLLRSQL
jgi:hypothetical protein